MNCPIYLRDVPPAFLERERLEERLILLRQDLATLRQRQENLGAQDRKHLMKTEVIEMQIYADERRLKELPIGELYELP